MINAGALLLSAAISLSSSTVNNTIVPDLTAANALVQTAPVAAESTIKDADWPVVLAYYTTKYDEKETERTVNLRVASAALDGKVLGSGGWFSFNDTVGKRTSARGYKNAKLIQNGRYVNGLGGGICQVSSTLFNAALKSNLKIESRVNHSLQVPYVPVGQDSAIYWGSQDLRFCNPYGQPVKLFVKCENGELTAAILAQSEITLPKITLEVTKEKNSYVLRRYADGQENYTTKSTYRS